MKTRKSTSLTTQPNPTPNNQKGDELGEYELPVPVNMNRHTLNSFDLTMTNLDNFVLPSLALLGGLIPRTTEYHKVG